MLFSFVGIASASTSIPLTSCSTICYGLGGWSGAVRGAQLSFTVSNPSLNCSSGDFFERDLFLKPNSSSDYSGNVGIVECAHSRGMFGGNCVSDGLSVIMQIQAPNGTYPLSQCTGIQTSDINHTIFAEIDDFLSFGGGIHMWAIGGVSGVNYNCTPCSLTTNTTNVFGDIELDDAIAHGSFTNHLVFGSQWYNNQYDSTSGNGWHYQSNNGLCSTLNNTPFCGSNPVQMYWNQAPAGGGNGGGTLYSCVYPSGNSCNLGS